jgi:hypothetical protein
MIIERMEPNKKSFLVHSPFILHGAMVGVVSLWPLYREFDVSIEVP